MIERDAYAKERFFLHLCDDLQGENPDEIEKDMHDRDHIEYALRFHSRHVLRMSTDNGNSYRQNYIEDALSGYENTMVPWCKWREESGQKIDYVRMEEEDFWSLGNSLGLNSLYETPQDVKRNPIPLKDEQRQRLSALNEKLGIQDDQALPTFGEVLKKRGVTRDAFLAAALDNRSI